MKRPSIYTSGFDKKFDILLFFTFLALDGSKNLIVIHNN
jgi:hypothetical protein